MNTTKRAFRPLSPFLIVLPLLSLNLCAAEQPATPATEIEVQDAYVRAVPPGQPNSAAFMHLTNTSNRDRALVIGETDAAEVVELHTHKMEDGMMRMRQLEQIELPAGETVKLQPGGLHVMLIGLTEDLRAGDSIELHLGFDDGSRQSLTLPVKRVTHGTGTMPAH
ncbi:copper chaperone PCu(A)C [Halochromatium glycolicum]|uniref:Copper chaperone PCu(A)C n=1 Tax=Halochromatium glycolicum TaxID=85075 RepID=A0AAJ0U188_9GAMM|nr:copper chaperone PCu(A)C [Halochromatium glycolicum]MBK1703394.1 hypothetical protein [Halochromatium glycolicum]